MLYKTVIHTNDGFSQLKKAISNWKNANILVVYKQIFEKVEEKIALQRAQEFPTLDKTPRYNEHEFLSM
jgi:vacuolar-type H+-ATPase subunit F/Vma7